MHRPVLVVSASTGTGHRQAGEAIRAALTADPEGPRVEHVDLLDLAPRWVRAAYGDGYELMAARAPWLWKQVYRRTDSPTNDPARWGPLAHRTLFREFRRFLLGRPWSVCLCTHFLPSQLAAGGAGFPPCALAVTDLTLHRYWAQPRVRRYFVGTEALAADVRRRVPGARVDATGIPIAPRFAEAPAAREARAMLGLDPRARVALVMGGGLGLGVCETAEAMLAAAIEGLQVVAVCGRNEIAASRLRVSGVPAERLRVIGYTEAIERYVAAADLVVTKPGGLTTSEVTALGRPLLLTRAIPGQEEGNTRVLTASGAALSAPSPREVRDAVERVFGDPALLAKLSACARHVGRPTAAPDIAAAVRAEYLLEAAA